MKKAALEAKAYSKNTFSITVDTLADKEKQYIEIAVWFLGFTWLDFTEWDSRRVF